MVFQSFSHSPSDPRTSPPARRCPRSLAKLVNISTITFGLMNGGYIYSIHGDYRLTNLTQMLHGAGIFTYIETQKMAQLCRNIFQHHGSHLGNWGGTTLWQHPLVFTVHRQAFSPPRAPRHCWAARRPRWCCARRAWLGRGARGLAIFFWWFLSKMLWKMLFKWWFHGI